MEELKEKLGVYARLGENEDFKEAMKDVESFLGLQQNIFGVIKAEQPTNFIIAKEGGRAVLDFLVTREEKLKAEFEARKAEDNEE